jgi:hypothetical protein
MAKINLEVVLPSRTIAKHIIAAIIKACKEPHGNNGRWKLRREAKKTKLIYNLQLPSNDITEETLEETITVVRQIHRSPLLKREDGWIVDDCHNPDIQLDIVLCQHYNHLHFHVNGSIQTSGETKSNLDDFMSAFKRHLPKGTVAD